VRRQNRQTRETAGGLLALVGLSDLADTPAGSLSYGALKRLEIARAVAGEPKILLLDEPAAGCNPVETEEIDEVIKTISGRGITVVLVEHDMRLVMKISNRIHVLDHGTTLAQGDAATVRSNPAVIAAYLGNRGTQHSAVG
jgi:branched-chain amino acid transport system ATP-binding protein